MIGQATFTSNQTASSAAHSLTTVTESRVPTVEVQALGANAAELTLRVEDEHGNKSTFTVEFPAHEAVDLARRLLNAEAVA
jgi:CYTH domain-containing protein